MTDEMARGTSKQAGEPDVDTDATPIPALNPRLLSELAQAEAHLKNSAAAARTQDTLRLAQSIDAVGREAQDLMRMQMRGLRLAANLSQAEVARRIGVRRQAISDYEGGKRTILPDIIHSMGKAVGAVGPQATSQPMSSALQTAQTALAGEETRAFELVASGISMEPAIHHGDRLMVSSEIELEAGRVVVAMHGDARIVKRLVTRGSALVLRSDNVDEEVQLSDVRVQGVVVELRRTL